MTDDDQLNIEKPSATPLLTPRIPVTLVETEAALKQAIATISSTTQPLAIDAERASGFRYGQQAYLIQVAVQAEMIFLIDPIAVTGSQHWQDLSKAISQKPWIIHAASQDLPCLSELGIAPIQFFDTELSARLLGLPRVGLGTITEHYLNLSLAKEHSAVDWSERPLRSEWLDYAALDVDVLHDLWRMIEIDLVSQKKLEWANQEFEFAINQPAKAAKVDRWRSTTGIHELKDARSLTIVKYIWEARESLARDKDIAPGRLIPDSSIVAAVKQLPKSKSELAAMKTFNGRGSRTYLDIWWQALSEGNSTRELVEVRVKSEALPHHRNWPSKFPEANARLVASKAVVADLSQQLAIPPENLISPEALRQICFNPPVKLVTQEVTQLLASRSVRKWQIELLAPLLVQTLSAKPESKSEPA